MFGIFSRRLGGPRRWHGRGLMVIGRRGNPRPRRACERGFELALSEKMLLESDVAFCCDDAIVTARFGEPTAQVITLLSNLL